jgi:uncharacterized SAM-binding protein YcdF (DUF218 family)
VSDQREPGTVADPLWSVTQGSALPAAADHTPPSGVVLDAAVPPGHARSGWRIVRRVALVVVLGLVGYYLVTLYQVWDTGRSDGARPADAIVVLGAAQYDGRPSPQLEARLEQALALYEAGIAPYVFVTGGNQPGDRFTEASTSAAYLVERGVPEGAILAEDQGSSTWESLQAVADALVPLGLDEVVIVTDPFHSLRSELMAEELGLSATSSPTRTSPVTGGRALVHHLQEAGGVAIARIVGFDRLESWIG